MKKTNNKNRSTRIVELIAKWSRCPEDRKHIEEGRRWVRDAFYVQVTEGQSNSRATSDMDSA